MMTTATLTLEVGALIRGQVKRLILQDCTRAKVSCDIQERKGLLSSVYTLSLVGEQLYIYDLVRRLRLVCDS